MNIRYLYRQRLLRRMRYITLILGVLVAATVIACGSDDDPLPTAVPTTAPQPTVAPQPTSAPAPTDVPAVAAPAAPATGSSAAADLVIPLGELNDSGQIGIASFRANGDQTEVTVSISSGAAGVNQPIHVHDGTCDTLGGVAHGLSAVADGSSVTTIDASLASIMGGAHAVNVHLSSDDAGTYVACGDIPAEGDATTIALGEQNDSGQSGTASLIANGNQTWVVLSISPGAAGVGQPVHIHQGTCADLGAVEHPLTAVSNGISVTNVDATMASLLGGTFSINVHESPDNAGTYVACGELGAGSVSSAPATGSRAAADLVIPLGELNDSGQIGIASFRANGDQTKVTVSISSGAAGVNQPIHVHDGTCDTLGGVAHGLSAVADGSSVTTIDASLVSIMGGAHAVNVHLSGDDAGSYVAYGDIPAEGDATTIALGEQNDSGQSGTASLIANGSQTWVVLSISPGAEGVGQPVHIHEGTCADLGGVEHPLTAVSNGISVTHVDATMANLLGGTFSINVHESADNSGVYVACGELGGGSSAASIGIGTDSSLGSILVDDAGITLYLFESDTAGVSNCAGGCLNAWPPLLTDGAPVALDGVSANLDFIERDDGTKQVTVNGMPAYYFASDAAPGDANGQRRGDVWWVMDSSGTGVKSQPSFASPRFSYPAMEWLGIPIARDPRFVYRSLVEPAGGKHGRLPDRAWAGGWLGCPGSAASSTRDHG